MNRRCTNCDKENVSTFNTPLYDRGPAWWSLNGYFGIFGYFCPECFEKVAHRSHHDNDGKIVCTPVHPKQYNEIAVKQRLQRANGG